MCVRAEGFQIPSVDFIKKKIPTVEKKNVFQIPNDKQTT